MGFVLPKSLRSISICNTALLAVWHLSVIIICFLLGQMSLPQSLRAQATMGMLMPISRGRNHVLSPSECCFKEYPPKKTVWKKKFQSLHLHVRPPSPVRTNLENCQHRNQFLL